MGTFAAGQVVLLPFPFSDLSRKKLRPALLPADAGRGDWIACQLTSNPYADTHAITLAESEFAEGVERAGKTLITMKWGRARSARYGHELANPCMRGAKWS